ARISVDAPLGTDGLAGGATVPPRPPRQAVLLHRALGHGLALVAVDPEQGERLPVHPLHQRLLTLAQAPAVNPPVPPEIEEDDLPAIVAQAEALAVEILAVNVQRAVAHAETDPGAAVGKPGLPRVLGGAGRLLHIGDRPRIGRCRR